MNRRELLKALGGLIPGLAVVSAGKAQVDSRPGHTHTIHEPQYQLEELRRDAAQHAAYRRMVWDEIGMRMEPGLRAGESAGVKK